MTRTEFETLPTALARADATPYTPWRSWHGSQSASPVHTARPRTEDELIDVVRYAIREGIPLRAMGGGFSFSPLVPTGGILLSQRHLTGITGIDRATNRVRMRAGTRIRELGDLLWAEGLALTMQGAFDLQSIAGVISTGTHGSGTDFSCFSSFVTWLRLIDGNGRIIEIDGSEPALLAAAQTSIGVLGVILEVELQVEPKYFLEQKPSYPSWEESMADLDDRLARNRQYQSMWFPNVRGFEAYHMLTPHETWLADSCWVSEFNKIDYDGPDTGERTWEPTIGRSYHVMTPSNPEAEPFHELEYSVRVEDSIEAVGVLRELMTTTHSEQPYPLFMRWVKGDETMLSPFSKRDAVTLSVAGSPATRDYWPFFRDVHKALEQFDARAHWGKLHFFGRDDVERLYPRLEEFVGIRRELDPAGVFLNDHTRQLFG